MLELEQQRKEHPEALAGLHADDIMIIADEASWVPDEIFETAMSAMTNPNYIFLMISNPTRLEWYFYNAFTDNAENFQTLIFNSEESPIVDWWFVNNVIDDYGKDSDQYRVRVLWEFPKAWLIDDKWWIPLFDPNEITFISPEEADFEVKEFDKLWIDHHEMVKTSHRLWLEIIFMQKELLENRNLQRSL